MRIAHNKTYIDRETKRKIRLLFFRQVEMKYIVKEVCISECVIRRFVKENNWIKKRERYLRFLCNYAYIHNIPLVKMSEKAHVLSYALNRIHKKYKTPIPKTTSWNKRINPTIEGEFVKEYNNGKTAQQIAEYYGFKTNKTVLDILIKNKIERRVSSIQTFYDKLFFEKINSHDKAYILGLIMTDGYIIKDYTGFGIQLTGDDGYILEKIAKIIRAKQGVSKINCDHKRKKMPNAKDMVRLTVHNRKIAEDLKKLGVLRNKSKTIRYNRCVPKKYMSSFFRGLIDGDGTIGINSKNGNIWCQICSSSDKFIDDLMGINIGFKKNINRSRAKYKNGICNMYALRVCGGNKETIRFLKWIYRYKGDLYLRRKYAKVQSKIS